MTRYDEALRARIVAHLERHERRSAPTADAKRAAVALTLVADGSANACLVLTKRAPKLKTHSGQWALPGGRIDAGEGVIEAALRELSEEVGLNAGAERVLGRLDDYVSRSGYCISPVVVWAGDAAALVANPDEVDSIHAVPLSELNRPDSPRFVTIPESANPVIRMMIWQTRIHAPTAAVLYQFREVALHGRARRVQQYESPLWAWR